MSCCPNLTITRKCDKRMNVSTVSKVETQQG
jgi:hypothetical protein